MKYVGGKEGPSKTWNNRSEQKGKVSSWTEEVSRKNAGVDFRWCTHLPELKPTCFEGL